jgi:hypothetical protein
MVLSEVKRVEASLFSAFQRGDALLVDILGPSVAVHLDVIEDAELNSHAGILT